jgi:riboflavin kinase/FMN adenylyltransferase
VLHDLPPHRLRTPLCLAAGVFDGVHLGHQEIISNAVELAAERGCRPAVLTFAPHPDTVLFHRELPLLTALEEKLALFRALGVQVTIVARFDRALVTTSAEQFVGDILAGRLHACCLTVGPGWRFGAGGRGDTALLELLSAEYGFAFHTCPPVMVEEALVSSTRIRASIAKGDVAAAARSLGREYQLRGEVQPGEQRGRKLGFPTANLDPPPFKALPADGVYACWAGVSRWRPAVVSIGVRPTFEDAGARRIEVHLLEAAPRPRLLGRRLHVAFVQFLREERRFDTAEALVAQMHEDSGRARSLLAALQPPALML